MRSVTPENVNIANALPYDFGPEELDLDGWGNVDFFCKHEDVLMLLEIEKGQKHPNTNVLKVWPFLNENPNQKILLIQIIRPENNAPKNRLKLCKYTGKKLEELYKGRFAYIYYNWHPDILDELKQKIEKKLDKLK